MGLEPEYARILDNVLRALSTATRSLRLYPASSPIPRETVDAAVAALHEYFATGPSHLALSVAREGFAVDGEPVATHIAVSVELAETLRDHGVAQVTIVPSATAEDLLNFLSVVSRAPEDVRAEGGIGAVVQGLGVTSVQLTDIQLVTLDQSVSDSADAEMRLREIADSPSKLGAWFTAASSGDSETLRSNLNEFVEVTGEEGTENLADTLAGTITAQPAENRDALLSLALEPGPARELAARMFAMMSAMDIAGAILGGAFGRNMLSLSSALANLPLDHVSQPIRQEVLTMLPVSGHGPQETAFLDHMLKVRTSNEIEPALAEADHSFRTIVQAGSVTDVDVSRAREATTAAQQVLDTVGVRTMFTLLDSQTEYERYSASVTTLAAMVPRLVEREELHLVGELLDGLETRQAAHPEWEELSDYLAQALSRAVDAEAAAGLLRITVADRSLAPLAKEILRFSGDEANTAVAREAIALKGEGLDAAEELVGRRLWDIVDVLAPHAHWYQLGPIVEHLAAQGDQRSWQTIESLMARPEEQARRDIIAAVAAAGGARSLSLLGSALRDPSEEVAAVAARAIAKSGDPGSAALLAARLNELDIDNTDFTRARELIGALARTSDPAAGEALSRLASRRAIIKRGHFAEVQQLVAQAISARQRGGA